MPSDSHRQRVDRELLRLLAFAPRDDPQQRAVGEQLVDDDRRLAAAASPVAAVVDLARSSP